MIHLCLGVGRGEGDILSIRFLVINNSFFLKLNIEGRETLIKSEGNPEPPKKSIQNYALVSSRSSPNSTPDWAIISSKLYLKGKVVRPQVILIGMQSAIHWSKISQCACAAMKNKQLAGVRFCSAHAQNKISLQPLAIEITWGLTTLVLSNKL